MLKKRENHSSQRDPKAKERKMVVLEIHLEKNIKLTKIKRIGVKGIRKHIGRG